MALIVRVHDEILDLPRLLVEVDADERERELAASNHDGGTLRLEVVQELAPTRRHVVARLEVFRAARDPELVLHVIGEVLRAQPHLLAEQRPRVLTAVVDKRLLDLIVRRVG